MSQKAKKNSGDDLDKSFAIRIISSIVDAVSALGGLTPEKTFSAIRQIVNLWRAIPEELKEKARKVLSKLWSNSSVLASTDPSAAREITEIQFEDSRLEALYYLLPTPDRSALRQGQALLDLQKKGLNDRVARIKDSVYTLYKERGLSILHMLSTGDIFLLLDELAPILGTPKQNKAKIVEKFNFWAENYTSFVLLVKPDELLDEVRLVDSIKELASSSNQNWIAIHLIGTQAEVLALNSVISNLKKNQELSFKDLKSAQHERGFSVAYTARIFF
ncbi:hypothetical protein HY572_06270 [Candidatus Micrarchaeota archaeon]|nr:hypothetical protein [Candidatus Micrarchaeota archaeon]